MTEIEQAYLQGFNDKCEEYGIKEAARGDMLKKLLKDTRVSEKLRHQIADEGINNMDSIYPSPFKTDDIGAPDTSYIASLMRKALKQIKDHKETSGYPFGRNNTPLAK